MSQEELVQIRPMKVDNRPGRQSYRYKYNQIHVEDITGDEFDSRVNINWVTEEKFWYQFMDSPRILVTPNACFVEKDSDIDEAELRLYFMLDILDSGGKVSGWRRIG